MTVLYDTIGLNYANLRQPEPRIAALIDAALGDAKTVLNIGAGAGSYEPAGRQITAVEPSAEMIRQRPPSDAVVVQGSAEDLPFDDNAFDGAMAVNTIHHWADQAEGVAELRRVTRDSIVFLTYEPGYRDFWLYDYFPGLVTLDEGQMPPLAAYGEWLGAVDIAPVPIPLDCSDGFLAGYWRRPAAYLDARVRQAMSSFWKIGDVTEGLKRLEADPHGLGLRRRRGLTDRHRRPVADQQPGQERVDHRPDRQDQHVIAPAQRGHDGRQRPLPHHAAGQPDSHTGTAEEGEPAGRKPQSGNHQAADKGERRTEADQRAAGIRKLDIRRETHGSAAQAGGDHGDRQHPARPPAIHHQAAGHLQRGIGPEVHSRQVADDGAADGEVAHDRLDCDGRCDPQDPGVEEKSCRQQPPGPGEEQDIPRGGCAV